MAYDCPLCDGTGVATFEGGGPAAEACTGCRGTGRLFGRVGDLPRLIVRDKGVLLDRDLRAVLLALEDLDERLRRLEAER